MNTNPTQSNRRPGMEKEFQKSCDQSLTSLRVRAYTQGMTNTQNTNNDIAELVALLPENLVQRFPDAEQRIGWIRTNYGITLAMAFKANKIISAI